MTDRDHTTPIEVAFPESGERRLRLTVGPAHLTVKPGTDDKWVEGTYVDPSGNIPCKVRNQGATVQITQESRWRGVMRQTPRFELQLGTAQPFALAIEAGAIESGSLDLGGVPLTSAELKLAAGQVHIDFSAPNPTPMDRFHLTTGATEFVATNLGQANASEIAIEGGAASLRLDFAGAVQRDCRITIKAGAAAVEIRVPSTTAAKITPQSILGTLDAGDGFMTREGAYWTEGALFGSTPVLTIATSVAVGSLKLRTTSEGST
jgi:hypothetical protein